MRGKRHSKQHVQEEEVDRISNLPDNLIHEILSFTDTRCAIQTCVLSKRWKNVWRSLPFISLDYGLFLDEQRYIDFVNKVFEFRDASCDVQRIKLMCLILDDDSCVEALNRWIIEAVDLNVQNLDIQGAFRQSSSYEIPRQLFNSKSLKALRFVMFGIRGTYTNIILPESMSLPEIKTLVLAGFSISDLQLQRLVSSCSLMERVCIHFCNIQVSNHGGNIIIDSVNLRDLLLIHNRHTYLDGSADDFLTPSIKICAPNLKYLSCTGFMSEDFSLENLSTLVTAHFGMTDETAETYLEVPIEKKQELAKRMLKHIPAVHNVKTLALSSEFLEVLVHAPGSLNLRPSQLRNLETLRLDMRITTGCLRSLAHLLKISPIVRVLIITSEESNLVDVGDDWEAELSSACMSSHLESVKIREVEGCHNELNFLRCFFENCMALQKLSLIFKSTSDERQIRRFKRSLTVLPKASSNIQIKYSNI